MSQRFYTELAEFHDLFFPKDRIVGEIAFVRAELDELASPNATVLELGCGTGRYLAELASCGFVPCGIDLSGAMLRIARERLPSATLIEGDFTAPGVMRCVGPCRLVLALSVVMMYVPDITTVQAVCRSVFDRLNPRGLFVFDLWKWRPATRGSLFRRYNSPGLATTATRAIEWIPEGTTLVSRDCFVLENRDTTHVVFDEHRLALFDVGELTEVLSQCGFTVEVRNGFTAERFKFADEKPVFLCRRG